MHATIKQLSEDDRPREKVIKKGISALSDSEILAILMGSGSRTKSAVDLAREILSTVDNDINKLARLSIHDLMKFKGVGEAKAITIAAALELGRRKKNDDATPNKFIKSSRDAYNAIKHLFEDLSHEEFYVIVLSRSNKILSIDLISKGGIDSTVVDGKVIFKKALEKSASGIILCHNHPSGNLKPSDTDIELTRKMKTFGAYIDMPVLDHIIVTDTGYSSFSDLGIL